MTRHAKLGLNSKLIVYGIAIAVIKLSILLQYPKIFVPNRKSNMRLFVCSQSLIWGNLAFYTANALLDIRLHFMREDKKQTDHRRSLR
jgi:hypothetical protein